MRGYLEVIDRFSTIAQDPASSGIAAVHRAGEIFRSRVPEEAINFYTKLLPETKNEAVQRAIRIQPRRAVQEHQSAGKGPGATPDVDHECSGRAAHAEDSLPASDDGGANSVRMVLRFVV